jgi:hypothetical protein
MNLVLNGYNSLYANQGLRCCGIKEISRLAYYGSPTAAMRDLYKMLFVEGNITSRRFRYCIFSEASVPSDSPASYGKKFCALITKCKMGSVLETQPTLNPNSGNLLKVYLWTVDFSQLERWGLADARRTEKRLSQPPRKTKSA